MRRGTTAPSAITCATHGSSLSCSEKMRMASITCPGASSGTCRIRTWNTACARYGSRHTTSSKKGDSSLRQTIADVSATTCRMHPTTPSPMSGHMVRRAKIPILCQKIRISPCAIPGQDAALGPIRLFSQSNASG